MQLPPSCLIRSTRCDTCKVRQRLPEKRLFNSSYFSQKGEPTNLPTTYPTIFQLIRNCLMKLSTNHYYRVENLVLENVIVVILKFVNSFLFEVCIKKLKFLNHSYCNMVPNICRLRTIDFSKLRKPRIGYADQQEIQSLRFDLATPGMIIICCTLAC